MDPTHTFVRDTPGEGLGMRIENRVSAGRPVFEAGLRPQRRELTARNMAWALLRYPFVAAQVAIGIYLQALVMWCRGARFHSHAGRVESSELPVAMRSSKWIFARGCPSMLGAARRGAST